MLKTIIDQEINAREKILETDPDKLLDKIGRAYGILQNSHLLSSNECMNLVSLVRFGVDLEMFSEEMRNIVDRLFIECQPGHIQHHAGKSIDTSERDAYRSEYLRKQFENVDKPENSILKVTTGEESANTESNDEEENEKG